MAYSTYYSSGGAGLDAINRGRTADDAVAQADNASRRSYLAALAQDRSRTALGNRELDVKQQLGNSDMELRRDLGTSEIGLRRFLGEGDMGLRRDLGQGEIDVRRELGRGAITQQQAELLQRAQLAKDRIAGELDLERLRGQNAINIYAAGGGVNPQVQREQMKIDQEQRQLQGDAESAALIANSLFETSKKSFDIPWKIDAWSDRDAYLKSNPNVSTVIVGDVLKALGANAGIVEFDPVKQSFVARRSLFPQSRTVVPAPQPRPPMDFGPSGYDSVQPLIVDPVQAVAVPAAVPVQSYQPPSYSDGRSIGPFIAPVVGAPVQEPSYQRYLQRQNR